MRRFYFPLWLTAVAVIMSLTSCDPLSSVDYSIYNKTSDTVTITMYKEIMVSSYHGYDIQENDSVVTHYEGDSLNVAVLSPDMVLSVRHEWTGLYREEQVVPFWKYIKSIKVGDEELAPGVWNTESAWKMKTKGGGRYQGESRYYDLILRDK
jgi:hypothetical protein